MQKIIGILNPCGNSFQGKNVTKIIVAKKASKVRLVDVGIDSHGASAGLNARAADPRRALLLATPMQEIKRSPAIALGLAAPRLCLFAATYAETRSRFLPVSATTAWASGWITPQDTISLTASSGLIGSSMTSRDGRKK